MPQSSGSSRPVYILSGAPRLAIDAVRYCSVDTTGATGRYLHAGLQAHGVSSTLLSSVDPAQAQVLPYRSRDELEQQLQALLAKDPRAVVVSAAAINDYQVAQVERVQGAERSSIAADEKLASGADEVVIRLTPAPKLIDSLRSWGHSGPLVAFKYEDAATVVASAQALQARSGAAVVLANSLCGSVQSLVDAQGVHAFTHRQTCLEALLQRIVALANG